MHNSLAGKTVAFMVAGGFFETEFTELQRTLMKAGAKLKTIAIAPGLVNGWDNKTPEGGFGHSYPVDATLGNVLAADLDALIIPGGTRSTAALATNMNMGRILRHMLDAEKPVVMFGAALDLLKPLGRSSDEASLMAVPTLEGEWATAALAHIVQFIEAEATAAKAA